MYKTRLGAMICSLFVGSGITFAEQTLHESPLQKDGPASGQELAAHDSGKWLVTYDYRFTHMDGRLNGDAIARTKQVLSDYPVAPKKLDTQVHELGLSYDWNDALSGSLRIPYILKEANYKTRTMPYATTTEGIGDIRLSAAVALVSKQDRTVNAIAGLSLPTGSIRQRDNIPGFKDRKLPYSMQLGSGTVDLLPGITYSRRYGRFSWGGQLSGTVRMGTNTEEYRLGHEAEADAWVASEFNDVWSSSVGLSSSFWGDISGIDPELDPTRSPDEDPRRQGGTRLDLVLGTKVLLRHGWFNDLCLSVEGAWPLYQNLEGPQLEHEWVLSFTVEASF